MGAQRTRIFWRWNNDSTSDGFEIETLNQKWSEICRRHRFGFVRYCFVICCVFIVTFLVEFGNLCLFSLCALSVRLSCVYLSACMSVWEIGALTCVPLPFSRIKFSANLVRAWQHRIRNAVDVFQHGLAVDCVNLAYSLSGRRNKICFSVCPSVRLSVCPSVRLSGFVSRPYLRKYSMDFFKISHTDRTSMEGVQRRSFVRFDEKMWKWQDFEN